MVNHHMKTKLMQKEQEEAVTLHHLDHRSVTDARDRVQLIKAVERDTTQLEGKARAVAGDLMIHKHLVELHNQHLAGHLMVEEKHES